MATMATTDKSIIFRKVDTERPSSAADSNDERLLATSAATTAAAASAAASAAAVFLAKLSHRLCAALSSQAIAIQVLISQTKSHAIMCSLAQ